MSVTDDAIAQSSQLNPFKPSERLNPPPLPNTHCSGVGSTPVGLCAQAAATRRQERKLRRRVAAIATRWVQSSVICELTRQHKRHDRASSTKIGRLQPQFQSGLPCSRKTLPLGAACKTSQCEHTTIHHSNRNLSVDTNTPSHDLCHQQPPC